MPVSQKYIAPHQRDVTQILAALVQVGGVHICFVGGLNSRRRILPAFVWLIELIAGSPGL